MGVAESTAISKFYKKIYEDVRCRLFHAKEDKEKLLPCKLEDIKKVREALKQLTCIVHKMIKQFLNLTASSSGCMPNEGFQLFMDTYLSGSEIILCKGENLLLKTKGIKYDQLCKDGRWALYCQIQENQLINTNNMNKVIIDVETKKNTNSLFQSLSSWFDNNNQIQLPTDLLLNNIDTFEIVITFQCINLQKPKSIFYI